MKGLKYEISRDGEVLFTTSDPSAATEFANEYIDAHPDDLVNVNYRIYRKGKMVEELTDYQIVEYLQDLGVE